MARMLPASYSGSGRRGGCRLLRFRKELPQWPPRTQLAWNASYPSPPWRPLEHSRPMRNGTWRECCPNLRKAGSRSSTGRRPPCVPLSCCGLTRAASLRWSVSVCRGEQKSRSRSGRSPLGSGRVAAMPRGALRGSGDSPPTGRGGTIAATSEWRGTCNSYCLTNFWRPWRPTTVWAR